MQEWDEAMERLEFKQWGICLEQKFNDITWKIVSTEDPNCLPSFLFAKQIQNKDIGIINSSIGSDEAEPQHIQEVINENGKDDTATDDESTDKVGTINSDNDDDEDDAKESLSHPIIKLDVTKTIDIKSMTDPLGKQEREDNVVNSFIANYDKV